jgi:hypothetical protein
VTVREVTFGGIPEWLLATYLVEMGGTAGEEGVVRGEGWTAKLVSLKAKAGGLVLGRVTVTMEGPSADDAMEVLRKKAQRGGG